MSANIENASFRRCANLLAPLGKSANLDIILMVLMLVMDYAITPFELGSRISYLRNLKSSFSNSGRYPRHLCNEQLWKIDTVSPSGAKSCLLSIRKDLGSLS